MNNTNILFEAQKITKHFGGLAAVNEFDFAVQRSEIMGLIGPNGAGKSTVFDLVSGFHSLTSGRIIFQGEDITGLRPHKIAERGIGRDFQTVTLFMKLSAFDNVLNGFHLFYRQPVWKSFLHTSGARKEEGSAKKQALEILEHMGLLPMKDILVQNLPHGHQKVLGVCVALATRPTLLLLDEPLTGMHAEETETMIKSIKQIRDQGITIMLIEHNIDAVMRLCDRIVVLNHGEKLAEGMPEEIRNHKEVIEAYLGTDEEEGK